MYRIIINRVLKTKKSCIYKIYLMSNMDKSTPISQINSNNDSSETVNNILNDFNNDDNDNDNDNYNDEIEFDNTSEFKYNTDKVVYDNVNTNSNDSLDEYNNIIKNNQNNNKNKLLNNNKKINKSFTNKILEHVKSPLTVFIILFIFSFPFFDRYFSCLFKKACDIHGELTYIGIFSKALLGSIIFYILNNFIF